MALFQPKEDIQVGIELGSAATKVVALRHDEKGAHLITYGTGTHQHVDIRNNSKKDIRHLVDTIQKIFDQARVPSDRVIVALPAMHVFHTTIEIPTMSKKDMESAVQWEAKRILPLPVEKMSLDWHLVNETPSENNTHTIIITAASKEIVDHYLDIIKAADLSLIGMETEINALQRSIIPPKKGNYAIIDMGARNTNTIIFSDGLPTLVRNVNIGIVALSNNIAQTLDISIKRAKSMRDEVGLRFQEQPHHPASGGIKFVMESMITKEIKRVFDAFKKPIDHVYLTGGASHLPGAQQYFATALGHEVSIGDPWHQISYHPELAQTLHQIGPEMAVAVGLALRAKKPAA